MKSLAFIGVGEFLFKRTGYKCVIRCQSICCGGATAEISQNSTAIAINHKCIVFTRVKSRMVFILMPFQRQQNMCPTNFCSSNPEA